MDGSKDLVYRDTVRELISQLHAKEISARGGSKASDVLNELYSKVTDIPAVNAVETISASWEMYSYDEAICTHCGYDHGTPFESTKEAREKWHELPDYCEACGAKMQHPQKPEVY